MFQRNGKSYSQSYYADNRTRFVLTVNTKEQKKNKKEVFTNNECIYNELIKNCGCIMLKKFLCVIGAILSLLIFCALIIVAINLFDQKLDPRIVELERQFPPLSDSQNAYIAFYGLDAPEGKSIVSLGRERIETESKRPIESEWSIGADDVGSGQSTHTSPPSALNIDDDLKKLHCLSKGIEDQEWGETTPCASEHETHIIFTKYQNILSNYQSLKTYEGAEAPTFHPAGNDLPYNNALDMQRLVVSKIIFESQQNHPDNAIELWLASASFLRKILEGANTPTEHVLANLAIQLNLNTLAILLEKHPDIVRLYEDQITQQLSIPVFGTGSVSLDKVILAEQRNRKRIMTHMMEGAGPFAKGRLFLKENASHNKAYEESQAVKKEIEDAYRTGQRHKANKESAKSSGIIDFVYNPVGKILFNSPLSYEVYKLERHGFMIARMRLLGVYVQAISKNITSRTMPSFLQSLPSEWNNPLTNASFEWNPTQKTLSFKSEDNPMAQTSIRFP